MGWECITIHWFVLQRRLGWKILYCNALVCIAGWEELYCRIVLQEGHVYCNRESLAAEETVLQYSLVDSRFVLQYKLYCELGVGMCRDTTRARQQACAPERALGGQARGGPAGRGGRAACAWQQGRVSAAGERQQAQ